MKLSFSLPSKTSSKSIQRKPAESFNGNSKEDGEIKHEYVTEFDPSKSLEHSEKLVIPPKSNEWRPLKKMKNIDLPVRSSADDLDVGFEPEAPSTAGIPDSNMSFGLNLRQDKEVNTSQDDKDKKDVDAPAPPGPSEDSALQKFKDDMKNLPDDRGFDEFVDVPVESFAAALLSGYGWREGMGIGRNTKEDVKVVEYTRRAGMTGLGFVDTPGAKNLQGVSNGQNVTQKGSNEKKTQVNDMPAPPKPRAPELNGDQNREEKKDHRHERGDKSGGKDHRRKDDARRKEEERRDRGLRHSDASHSDNRREEGRRRTISWLTRHIRVRIISNDFRGGKLYLKKGEVLDVVGPTTCDISMDENRELIQGVDQKLLETALPRRGGPVLVLYGKHKDVFGSLVEKNVEEETGVIQDADTHALLNVRLEQIAEYVGDPSYLGY